MSTSLKRKLLTYADIAVESRPGHIILVLNQSDHWSLPGALLLSAEAPRDAAKRIAKIETGLAISIHERLSKYIFVNAEQMAIGSSTLFAAKGYGEFHSSEVIKEFNLENLPAMTAETSTLVTDYLRWTTQGIRPELQKKIESARAEFSEKKAA